MNLRKELENSSTAMYYTIWTNSSTKEIKQQNK